MQKHFALQNFFCFCTLYFALFFFLHFVPHILHSAFCKIVFAFSELFLQLLPFLESKLWDRKSCQRLDHLVSFSVANRRVPFEFDFAPTNCEERRRPKSNRRQVDQEVQADQADQQVLWDHIRPLIIKIIEKLVANQISDLLTDSPLEPGGPDGPCGPGCPSRPRGPTGPGAP